MYFERELILLGRKKGWAEDIDDIINHGYVLKTGELRSNEVPFFDSPDDYEDAVIYRERPFFECYLDDL